MKNENNRAPLEIGLGQIIGDKMYAQKWRIQKQETKCKEMRKAKEVWWQGEVMQGKVNTRQTNHKSVSYTHTTLHDATHTETHKTATVIEFIKTTLNWVKYQGLLNERE